MADPLPRPACRSSHARIDFNVAGEFATEDLFPDDYYLKIVESVYSKQLAPTGTSKLTLTATDMLCKRVDRALDALGIKFNKGSVAKVLRHQISRMKTFDELPKQTQERGRLLIAAVRKAFP